MKKQLIQMAILLVIVVGLVFVIAFASQSSRRTAQKPPRAPVTS